MTRQSVTPTARDLPTLTTLHLDILCNLQRHPEGLPYASIEKLTACDAPFELFEAFQRLRAEGLAYTSGGISQLTPLGQRWLKDVIGEPEAQDPPPETPTALCCIDEDELDGWWEDQDVEVKADAFLRWALDRTTSFIYAGDTGPRIPIAGTIGDEPTAGEQAAWRTRNAGDGTYAPAPSSEKCRYCGEPVQAPFGGVLIGASVAYVCDRAACQMRRSQDVRAANGGALSQGDGDGSEAQQ